MGLYYFTAAPVLRHAALPSFGLPPSVAEGAGGWKCCGRGRRGRRAGKCCCPWMLRARCRQAEQTSALALVSGKRSCSGHNGAGRSLVKKPYWSYSIKISTRAWEGETGWIYTNSLISDAWKCLDVEGVCVGTVGSKAELWHPPKTLVGCASAVGREGPGCAVAVHVFAKGSAVVLGDRGAPRVGGEEVGATSFNLVAQHVCTWADWCCRLTWRLFSSRRREGVRSFGCGEQMPTQVSVWMDGGVGAVYAQSLSPCPENRLHMWAKLSKAGCFFKLSSH